MLFADQTLARRLEVANALEGVDYARAHAKRFPYIGSTSMQIMGGYAIFAGADSPLTQAFGLGLSGAVTETEVDDLEEFFSFHEAPTNIELCPLADPGLIEMLMKRGYRVLEYSNVLYHQLAEIPTQNADISVRIPNNYEDNLWARVVSLGFVPMEEPEPMMMEITVTMFHSEASVPFLVELEGQPAGGGGLFIHKEIADCYGHATLQDFRGRGVQTALIQTSLAHAKKNNCELVMATTMPGTTSQRNFERQGFRIAYTRTKLTNAKI